MIVDEGVDFNLDASMGMYANDDFQLPDGAFGAVSPSPANILSSAGKTGRTNRKVCPVLSPHKMVHIHSYNSRLTTKVRVWKP